MDYPKFRAREVLPDFLLETAVEVFRLHAASAPSDQMSFSSGRDLEFNSDCSRICSVEALTLWIRLVVR